MPFTATDLGPIVAAYGWDRRRARTLFWVHFPLALVHLPLAFVFIGLPGLVLFGCFAVRSFRRWRARQPVFELHEHGWTDRRKGLPQRHDYAALAGYQLIDRHWRFPFPFNFIQIHHIGLVARVAGRHFVVNEHLADIARCIAHLQQGVVRQRLAIVREQIAQGGEPRFGHLRVTKAGLQVAKRFLPWTALGAVRAGAWQVGRRQDVALQLLDANGNTWDVLTRNDLLEPAVFILLVAEHVTGIDAPALLKHFCAMEMPAP